MKESLRCLATSGEYRCDLRRDHPSMHHHHETYDPPRETVSQFEIDGVPVKTYCSGYDTGWADSVEQVEESGLFAPWLTDALRENEKS